MILTFETPTTKPQTPWGALARWAGLAMLGVFGALIVLALFVAFTAAAVIGLIFAAAMVVLRMVAKKPQIGGAEVTLLEGRRTAEGWVVEAEVR